MGWSISGWYAKWMFAWETELTTRDTNRIVRATEWGFDWLPDAREFPGPGAGARDVGAAEVSRLNPRPSQGAAGAVPTGNSEFGRMVQLSAAIAADSDSYFGYTTPTDFRIEHRHPQLFPTNVRPETLEQDQWYKDKAASGDLATAEFLRFTSAAASKYPENDQVNARWYPASAEQEARRKARGLPRQAMVVMPQWNADAFSHNALCEIFNRFGISCLRLSKPYHDIRRPPELERSDYAVSSNIGRTMAACQQAVIDIRSCLDWLQTLQGYHAVWGAGDFAWIGLCVYCGCARCSAEGLRVQPCFALILGMWFGRGRVRGTYPPGV